MTEVAFNEINDVPKPAPKKNHIKFPINSPPPKSKHVMLNDEQILNRYVPDELKTGLKSLVLYGLSFPAGSEKRKRLMLNLHQSKYTNDYLNKYLCVDAVAQLDDHTKFLGVYAINFIDALMFNNAPLEKKSTQ